MILILIVWPYYLIPVLAIGCPIWYWGRNKVTWMWSDYIILILPYLIWAALMYVDHSGKNVRALRAFLLGALPHSLQFYDCFLGKGLGKIYFH